MVSGFFLIAAATGALAYWMARRNVLTDRTDPIAYGWLNPAVQAVKKGNAFVVAYVLTKTSHEGASIAYEGVVQQLALDDDQSIKLVILNEVDRFLVKITEQGIERLDAETTPITQLQITATEIANIALEVVRAEDKDVAAIEVEH